jgi:hypothetical protein
MRTEVTGPNGRKNIVIYDGGAQVMRIIDEGAKTYSEMTKADVDRLATQMSGAMAQMQVQMQFAEFFSRLMPQGMDRLFSVGASGPAGFSGIPVRSVNYDYDTSGKETSVVELTDASRQAFPDSLFAVPAGFQKREFPGMGRGRQ